MRALLNCNGLLLHDLLFPHFEGAGAGVASYDGDFFIGSSDLFPVDGSHVDIFQQALVKFLTGFEGCTMGTMQSTATTCLLGLIPFAVAFSISSFFISRLMLAIFAVPSTMAFAPLPLPPPDTEILTPGLFFMKASAVDCAKGRTVVDPFITISPAAKAAPANNT